MQDERWCLQHCIRQHDGIEIVDEARFRTAMPGQAAPPRIALTEWTDPAKVPKVRVA